MHPHSECSSGRQKARASVITQRGDATKLGEAPSLCVDQRGINAPCVETLLHRRDRDVSLRNSKRRGLLQRAPVLVIRALGKRYRAGVAGCWADARALVDIHLEIREGEVVALVGTAGAGKTTLLRCAARLLAPDEGSIEHPPRADGRESVVQYFDDCVQATRAAARGRCGDLGLIDDVDQIRDDVAAAIALVRVLAHARSEGSSLLLAAREPNVLRELSDRTLTLKHGSLVDRGGATRPALARVAEHAAPLTVIPGAPSIR